jgi:hypothetical protein
LEFPAALFSILVRFLRIRRGALMTLDHGTTFLTPWASEGLDETSRRRLRIPLESIRPYLQDRPLQIRDAGYGAFKMFLSNRDFRSSAALSVFPIPYGQDAAVYALSLDRVETDPDTLVPAGWATFAAALGGRLEVFFSRFSRKPETATDTDDPRASAEEALAGALADISEKGMAAIFMLVPFGPMIEETIASMPLADADRIFSEIVALLSRMVGPPGTVVALPRHKAGILYAQSAKPDRELILKQMGASLSHFLRNGASVSLEAETVLDPVAQADSLKELLDKGRSGRRA